MGGRHWWPLVRWHGWKQVMINQERRTFIKNENIALGHFLSWFYSSSVTPSPFCSTEFHSTRLNSIELSPIHLRRHRLFRIIQAFLKTKPTQVCFNESNWSILIPGIFAVDEIFFTDGEPRFDSDPITFIASIWKITFLREKENWTIGIWWSVLFDLRFLTWKVKGWHWGWSTHH